MFTIVIASWPRGIVKLKKIRKSEKNSDWPDPSHPPPTHFFFFWNMYSNKNHHKKHKISNKKNLSWCLTHPSTSEFFSDFLFSLTWQNPQLYVQQNWTTIPANTRRWNNVGLMLGHRRRRWPNIKPTPFNVSCLLGSPTFTLKRESTKVNQLFLFQFHSVCPIFLWKQNNHWTTISIYYFMTV